MFDGTLISPRGDEHVGFRPSRVDFFIPVLTVRDASPARKRPSSLSASTFPEQVGELLNVGFVRWTKPAAFPHRKENIQARVR